jgi:WXG100 family type VII secretion target
MGDFKTGTPELVQAGKDMVQTNEDLQDAGRVLAQSVDAVQGAWVGQAATAFSTLMAQYGDDFSKLNTALFNIAEQVAGSADAYAQQEEAAASDVSAIMSTLADG